MSHKPNFRAAAAKMGGDTATTLYALGSSRSAIGMGLIDAAIAVLLSKFKPEQIAITLYKAADELVVSGKTSEEEH